MHLLRPALPPFADLKQVSCGKATKRTCAPSRRQPVSCLRLPGNCQYPKNTLHDKFDFNYDSHNDVFDGGIVMHNSLV